MGSGHCHRERKYRYSGHCPLSCDATFSLDFLARLQRLPLTLQTPRLRILPTNTLNQVTLNQDLSVYLYLHSLLSICPKKMETEKWPKAAESPVHKYVCEH